MLIRIDLGEIPYPDAMTLMAGWVAERRAGQAPDRLFLLSHPPVVTYGKGTPPSDLPAGSDIPVVPVDRGGHATYHGPGQLVGYLVVDLHHRGLASDADGRSDKLRGLASDADGRSDKLRGLASDADGRSDKLRGPGDVVRWLEHGLISALSELGFPAIRRDTPPGMASLVGVWTPDLRKVASIGMRIRGGVTSHGFALNVDPDLTVFDRFTACRLPGVAMTSLRELATEAGRATPTDTAVRDAVATALGASSG